MDGDIPSSTIDSASDTFKPEGDGAKCGAACHELAAGKDYVFTVYGKR